MSLSSFAGVQQPRGGNNVVSLCQQIEDPPLGLFFFSIQEALQELQVLYSRNRSILVGAYCSAAFVGAATRAGLLPSQWNFISQAFMQTRDQTQFFQMLLTRLCTLLHNTPFGAQLKTEAKQRDESIWLLCTDCLSKK